MEFLIAGLVLALTVAIAVAKDARQRARAEEKKWRVARALADFQTHNAKAEQRRRRERDAEARELRSWLSKQSDLFAPIVRQLEGKAWEGEARYTVYLTSEQGEALKQAARP